MKRKGIWPLLLIPVVFASLALTACGNASSATQTTAATTPTLPSDGQVPTDRTPPNMDWAGAAAKLGTTEEQLRQAFEGTEGKMPDMAAIASTLEVTEKALREALGIPAGGPGLGPGGQNPVIPPDGGSTPTPDTSSSNSNTY
jgi:hypothetical protein